MSKMTFPNQRMIHVNRERLTGGFLGIKNENWMAASRDLGAHALQLYLYLESNANNFMLALSPAAIKEAIGMARSTIHDQFRKLVAKGYLVPSHGNTFEFYETPQSVTQARNDLLDAGQDLTQCTGTDNHGASDGHENPAQDIEIYNTNMLKNKVRINRQNYSTSDNVQQEAKKEEFVF